MDKKQDKSLNQVLDPEEESWHQQKDDDGGGGDKKISIVEMSKKRSIHIDGSEDYVFDNSVVKKLKAEISEVRTIETVNNYNGWVVPQKDYIIPSISIENVAPKEFYEQYVSQRKPIVLKGKLRDLEGLNKWIDNNNHLRKCAGNENVMVEVRSNIRDSFGRGNEIAMTFNEFLDLMEKGDEMHYLTTQDVEANEDGQPDLMAPFMKALKDDFPNRPELMGNLIPQNLNLWFGNNKDGASSGLHHDYHDNLYILLRGKKKFRLYSPADTENMYSRGKLLKVHHNGRINYEGEETTPYGADLLADSAAKAFKAKEEAERMLLEAEQKVKDGIPGAQDELELAEEMLDKAMDVLIDIEMDEEEAVSDNEFDEHEDNDKNDSDDDSFHYGIEETSNPVRNLVDKTVKDPNNFSVISPDTLLDEETLQKQYPLIHDTKAAVCELNQGDILYLPASWWHEVKSFGGLNGHLAMNFWFHPPDKNSFTQPYSTDFWPNDYKLRFSK